MARDTNMPALFPASSKNTGATVPLYNLPPPSCSGRDLSRKAMPLSRLAMPYRFPSARTLQ